MFWVWLLSGLINSAVLFFRGIAWLIVVIIAGTIELIRKATK